MSSARSTAKIGNEAEGGKATTLLRQISFYGSEEMLRLKDDKGTQTYQLYREDDDCHEADVAGTKKGANIWPQKAEDKKTDETRLYGPTVHEWQEREAKRQKTGPVNPAFTTLYDDEGYMIDRKTRQRIVRTNDEPFQATSSASGE